jgi:hypothetical protein
MHCNRYKGRQVLTRARLGFNTCNGLTTTPHALRFVSSMVCGASSYLCTGNTGAVSFMMPPSLSATITWQLSNWPIVTCPRECSTHHRAGTTVITIAVPRHRYDWPSGDLLGRRREPPSKRSGRHRTSVSVPSGLVLRLPFTISAARRERADFRTGQLMGTKV